MRRLIIFLLVAVGLIGTSWLVFLRPSAVPDSAAETGTPASPSRTIPSAGTVRSTVVVARPGEAPPLTPPVPDAPPREVPFMPGPPSSGEVLPGQ